MAVIDYLNFDLTIVESATGGYEVHASSPLGEARAPLAWTISDDGIKYVRSQIETAVLRRSNKKPTTRRAASSEMKELQAFGAKLFDAVINADVRSHYAACFAQANQAGYERKGLRVRLHVPPKFENIPWEFLYNQTEREFVGLSRYAPIVRYLDVERAVQSSLQIAPPLRLVVVLASPRSAEHAPLDVEREKRVIAQALGDLQARKFVQVEYVEGPDTDRQLANTLTRDCHILHFVCHGGYDHNTEEGVLLVENESGEEKFLGSDNLRMLIGDSPATRLVVLNACEGTVASQGDPFSSVAGGLVRAGVPAVVAMQFEISDNAAITMARDFYTRLAQNFPVDAALAEARKQVKLQDPDSVEWGTPVLFMRVSNAQLFELSEAPAPEAEPAERPSATGLFDLYLVGKGSYDKGQWREALEVLNRVQAIRGNFRDVPDMIAVCQGELDKIKGEEARQAQMRELMRRAQAASATEDWSTVATQTQAVLAMAGTHAQAMALLKHAQQQQALAIIYAEARQHGEATQWREALDDLRRLKALQGDYKDVNVLLATAEREQVRADAERQRIERIATVRREAQQAMAKENWQLAVERWQAVLNLEPSDNDAASNLQQSRTSLEPAMLYAGGLKQYEARQWLDALRMFEQLRQLQPNYKNVELLIGNAQRELGKLSEMERKRAQINTLSREAQAAVIVENWDMAIDRWQTILELEPANTDVANRLNQARQQKELALLYHSGRQHYDARRWQDALNDLRRIKSMARTYKDVDALMTYAQNTLAAEMRTQTVNQPRYQPAPKSGSNSLLWIGCGIALTLAVLGCCLFLLLVCSSTNC